MKTLSAAVILVLSLPCHAAENAWSKLLTLPDVTPAVPPVQIVSDYRVGRVYVRTEGGNFYRSADGGVTWKAVSPKDDPGGGSRALALDPVDSNTVYRTAARGVFKSTTGGLDWRRIDSGFPYPSWPHALTVASDAPETVYVSISPDCVLDTCQPGGIMKSQDGGNSWHLAGLEGHSALAIIADRESTLYAIATKNGARNVYKSPDGGKSWMPMFGGDTLVHSWVVHPHDPQTIYMTAQFQFFRLLYRSTNGGRTWTWIRPAIEGFQPPPCPPGTLDCIAEPMVASIILDPRHPGVVYGADWRSVVRSMDGGITWRYVTGLPEDTTVTVLTLDGDTLLAGVRGKTPGTTGVHEYTFTSPPPARRRAVPR